MRSIARFFTLFWCIYFPTCIAFNDLPGFSSIDEVMTGILIVFTFALYGRKITNRKPWTEYWIFFGLLAFYIVYSLIMRVNVVDAIWYDLMQQIRPWSVIFCTWILNPRFSKRQKKWMLYSMVLSLIVFLFYHPETRANLEGGENRNAPFGQLAISTSMAWYLFTKQTKRNLYIATAIAIIGLLGMKFKYYGEVGAWMFMLYFMRGKFKFDRSQIVLQLGVLLFVVVLLGWERFDTYYVEGIDNEELARPMMNKAAWQMLWDYFPFGTGLGTFATAASAVYYSPLWEQYGLNEMWGLQNYGGSMAFHGDSFFASLAQIGWFGIFFFTWFWLRRIKEISTISDMRYYRVGMMAFFCTFIEWWGDSAFFSGKGMGYLMLMGICLNMAKPIKRKRKLLLSGKSQ